MRSFEFFVKPGPGEEIRAAVPLGEAHSAVISGQVSGEDAPVPGALVLLLDQGTGSLIAHTVTDPLGRFWFGPLPPDTLYFLRVQKQEELPRAVELTT